MSDFNSSLPVRTQNNGDVVVEISDGTTPSQKLAVDSSGRITTKMDDGSGNAITSQVNGAQRALDVGIDVAGVQIDPRAIRALTSADVVTANQGSANTIANAWPVKPTDGTNSATFTAAGETKVSVTQPLPAGSNNIGSVNQGTSPWVTSVNNLPATVDTNYGTVGASTIRVASEPGNATGIADFNNGASGAQTLRVAANLAIAGANVSSSNPVPVTIASAPSGTSVVNYNTAASLAAAASSNHTYTITTGKIFNGKYIHAAASGKLKIEVQISADGVTYSTIFVGFNSTASPNIDIQLDELVFLESGVGSTVRVIRTNLDLVSQDVYSTICGTEV